VDLLGPELDFELQLDIFVGKDGEVGVLIDEKVVQVVGLDLELRLGKDKVC
jgi:hypothetical protein